MIHINELYIRVHTSTELLEFHHKFSSKLNVITSYANTKGKSTIGESILFCLGLEEILGQKNEKAVKPVLRSKIEVDNIEESVVQSDVFLEIENFKGEVITIQRSPKSNCRDAKLASVYNCKLGDVLKGACEFTDYFVHDPGAAKNIRGFHNFLEEYAGFELPDVATYDGKLTKLYIQTLASCFYIEQKKGWMNVLATLPTYFKIKDVKKRVLEFVMGLSTLETKRNYNILKTRLTDKENEWKIILNSIDSRINNSQGINIVGIKEQPHIINDEETYRLLLDCESKDLVDYMENIKDQIILLNNIKEPTIENQSNSLRRELNELDELLEKFYIQKADVQQSYLLEEEQLRSIHDRLNYVNKDLSENLDLKKLIRLGSLENMAIAKSHCPTCGQSVNDTLFSQNGELKIMKIEESIILLKNEKEMLVFSRDAQQINVNAQKELLSSIDYRIKEITSRIRIVKSDLISNNKAISESHIHKIVELEMKRNNIETLMSDISNLWEKLEEAGKQWNVAKANLEQIPADFLTEKDRVIINKLKFQFRRLLNVFKFESTNVENIEIDDYNYLPNVEGFDLYADSSASDTIRIIWAYLIALQYVAIEYGNTLGFIVLDEPAQQNTDLSSAKELLKELVSLSASQQVFVFYKLESDELFNGLEETDYHRIHTDDFLVKKKIKHPC